MLWSRLRRAVISAVLSTVIIFGPAQAYEIPDGVDPATVIIGHIAVDTYDGYLEPSPIYASDIDQAGIYTVPDGYIFMPGTSSLYVTTRYFAIYLSSQGLPSNEADALIREVTMQAAAEFKVGPGPYDTSGMSYFDMTPLNEAARAAAPDFRYLIDVFVPTGPRLILQDSFETYAESAVAVGAANYGLDPSDPGLLEILTLTPTFEPVANTGPTADAGADQAVASGAAVTLDGTGSSDPDVGDTLSYAWTQTSGTTVSLTGATTAAPGFTAPALGANDPAVELVFSLVVNDGVEDSAADTVQITVNPPVNMPPTADAGADQTVASGASVTLDGTGSSDPDAGDTLSYAWTQTSGTTVSLTGATTATPGFTAPEIGPYDAAAAIVFSLIVTDDKGNVSDADTLIKMTISSIARARVSGSPILTREHCVDFWAEKANVNVLATPFTHDGYETMFRPDKPFQAFIS